MAAQGDGDSCELSALPGPDPEPGTVLTESRFGLLELAATSLGLGESRQKETFMENLWEKRYFSDSRL